MDPVSRGVAQSALGSSSGSFRSIGWYHGWIAQQISAMATAMTPRCGCSVIVKGSSTSQARSRARIAGRARRSHTCGRAGARRLARGRTVAPQCGDGDLLAALVEANSTPMASSKAPKPLTVRRPLGGAP
jgi:hypothetical protein